MALKTESWVSFMLSVIMFNVIMLNDIMPNVVTPLGSPTSFERVTFINLSLGILTWNFSEENRSLPAIKCCVCVWERVCVCVCEWERVRESERERVRRRNWNFSSLLMSLLRTKVNLIKMQMASSFSIGPKCWFLNRVVQSSRCQVCQW